MPPPTRVVVLDDDPTGTQAAGDVTVLLEADADALTDVLTTDRCVYVQTNSRALGEYDAITLVGRIRDAARRAADRLGAQVRFVLRGDSTLRGHVIAESRVFCDDDAVIVFVPAFPGGGRITRDGVHQVWQDDRFVPVAQTEYAADPVFGYSASDLVGFIAERTDAPAVPVTAADVRAGRLEQAILAAPAGAVLLPDAITDEDIAAIADAVTAAWRRRNVVVRSAAPLAAELGGVRSAGPLDPATLAGRGPVLVVCGSHTQSARTQVAELTAAIGAPTVIDTAAALSHPRAEGQRVAAVEAAAGRPHGARWIASDRDRAAEHNSLRHGAAVMAALVTATRLLAPGVNTVVTKGGITAADVITSGLGARRARVLGQVRPGISVWRVSAEDGREIPCVIVPGNMGDDDILALAVGWTAAR